LAVGKIRFCKIDEGQCVEVEEAPCTRRAIGHLSRVILGIAYEFVEVPGRQGWVHDQDHRQRLDHGNGNEVALRVVLEAVEVTMSVSPSMANV
jgi:hypothetical protein